MSIKKSLFVVLCWAFVSELAAQQAKQPVLTVFYTRQNGAFPLISNKKSATIYYDTADARVVSIAAEAFTQDITAITDITPATDSLQRITGYSVIAGTIGKNRLIDRLILSKKLSVSAIKDKWEAFSIAVIDNPFNGCKQALVIAGSDPRGTAFGIFELSRMLGVSPFTWWADIVPVHRDEIYITKGLSIAAPPSVKYRGIFINDEDWGLQPWAAKTFEPETGDIGPKTYAKVFELLLRLKANLIWPAMHPSTKAFYHYPGNKKVAEDYSIIIGSSHAEPMLRNNVGEWKKETMGDFNYITNKQRIYQYWEDRVKEASTNEVVFTLGMRGIHDSGLEGVKDPRDAVPLLENIFEDQRGMIRRHINNDIIKVPQAFTAYKEVLDIYDNNLKVPDDVIITWPDDNYGYIQRMNDEKEKKRPGGSGVYYHASYWGRPHDYLWLSTTHPALVREEMMKAWEMKADKLWILNVGDIKPLEYNIEQFLDMAYNTAQFRDPDYVKQHLYNWAGAIFGKDKAAAIQQILWQYYQLAFERRPEFMGWSQTEPTTKTTYTSYNHYSYGDQAQQRIDRYDSLEKMVRSLRTRINAKDTNAFYQLVYYPVVCASLMNKKFLYRDKSYLYAKQNRVSAYQYKKLSEQAYEDILKETEYYNKQLAGGKWNHIMSMEPRKLPVYQKPDIADTVINRELVWDVVPEGYDTLPEFDAINDQQYFIDIFLAGNNPVSWTATVSADWIRLSQKSGTLDLPFDKCQARIYAEIDWRKAPKGELKGLVTFIAAGKERVVEIKGRNISAPELASFKGFLENNRIVSIYATNYSGVVNRSYGQWKVLPGLGHTGKSLQTPLSVKAPDQITEDEIRKNNSYVSYDFYSFGSAVPAVSVYSLPTHPVNRNYSMRYAVSIDDGPLQVIDFRTFGRSEEWKQNVLRNSAIKRINMPLLHKGKHQLKIYSIDPGVVLDRIIIDLGGLKNVYGIIEETKGHSSIKRR
jgi:hypothetical protein